MTKENIMAASRSYVTPSWNQWANFEETGSDYHAAKDKEAILPLWVFISYH
jgi:hypothetical protein